MPATVHGEGQGAARVAVGAGVMLRQTREAQGLTREALAARTRLELRVIDALEREDYNSLAASAFVKGYIRSIAKELHIDPAPVLAQYAQYVQLEEPALADFTTRSPVQITSSSTLMRGVSIALLALVVALVAVWWRRNYQAEHESPAALAKLAAQAKTEIATDPASPLPYTYTIVDHSTQPLDPVNSWRHQTDGTTPPAAAAEADTAPVATDPVTSAPTAPLEAVANPPSEATGELVLDGDNDAWVEVSDVAGKRLFFGMLKAAQHVAVTGKAPYDLVIGNAAAVKVTFRGAAVDVRARAVNGIARFALGDPN